MFVLACLYINLNIRPDLYEHYKDPESQKSNMLTFRKLVIYKQPIIQTYFVQ